MRLQQIGEAQTGCPTPDMLIAVGEGVLPETVERSVELHLDVCRTCAMLRRDLTASAIAEPTLEELTRVKKRVHAFTRRTKNPGARYAAFAAGIAIVLMLPLAWKEEKPVVSLPERPANANVHAANSAPTGECQPVVAKAPLRLPLATAMVMRGAGAVDEQRYLRELGHALDPYRTNDFRKASALLERLASRYPKRVEPVFYLGVARLLGGDARAAASALESAKRIGSEELDGDIATYLSTAQQAAACNLARK